MSDPELPKIRVTDSQAGEATMDSSSTPTDASTRPRTATSEEGLNGKKSSLKLTRNTSGQDTNGSSAPSSPIDPLSHHIINRTSPDITVAQKLRNSPDNPLPNRSDSGDGDVASANNQGQSETLRVDSNQLKEKKKGVSFLSRFSIGKRKDQDFEDNESELGDLRTEGMNAHVFSSSHGANGYIPQHKEPPRYIKVRAHDKKEREFDRMFLAQELNYTKHSPEAKTPKLSSTSSEASASVQNLSKLPKNSGAVWAAEFSKDGKYFAAAGRDQVVRIWAVISTPEERQAHEDEENNKSGGERLSAPVFRSKAIREFKGHTGDILDLSWSKNNFLLSSSMDKTVRLWHISRQECLCTFKHKDFVTSIAFHPTDDRFFLAGSLDSVLRLWSIPDKAVAFWNQLPDLITAVAFSPDGKTAIAGVLSGLCLFYDTEGLKYNTQIHVRSSRGKNAKGSKITGIRTIYHPPDSLDGEVKVLITSNDSRIRLYNLKDKSLDMKFRGHENQCSQINASFSDDGKYVICGSEDRKAYIWSTNPVEIETKDKRPLELFEAHSNMVTAAIIAPTKSRLLLSASGDPIYNLCNPPPITLLSREESSASIPLLSGSEKRNSDATSELIVKRTGESPAYLARSTHHDGNIIITADFQGGIKVFRQDCAHQKRRNETWEAGSGFSKKMLVRSGSVMTRGSAGSQSRLNSQSQSSLAGPNTQSDHILSWRNNVSSLESESRNGAKTSPPAERSGSPARTNRGYSNSSITIQSNPAGLPQQQPHAVTPPTNAKSNSSTTSPPASLYRAPIKAQTQTLPPTPSFSLQSATDEIPNPFNKLDSSGRSNQFWNISVWKEQLIGSDTSKANALKPPLNRGQSAVSQLSSEGGLSTEQDDDEESEDDVLVCSKCGGFDFRTRKVDMRQRLACKRCGKLAN